MVNEDAVADGDLQIADCRETLDALAGWENICRNRTIAKGWRPATWWPSQRCDQRAAASCWLAEVVIFRKLGYCTCVCHPK